MTLDFKELYKLKTQLSSYSINNLSSNSPEKGRYYFNFRDQASNFKINPSLQDNSFQFDRSFFTRKNTNHKTLVSALIQKKKTDRKNEFIVLEHKLSVMFIPSRAIKGFLKQTDERNELLFHKMYKGTMIDSSSIRLLRSVNGFMLREVKDEVDLGVASLNVRHIKKLKQKNELANRGSN